MDLEDLNTNFDSEPKVGASIYKEGDKCPKCKVGMVVERFNRQDETTFLGCNKYPRCNFKH